MSFKFLKSNENIATLQAVLHFAFSPSLTLATWLRRRQTECITLVQIRVPPNLSSNQWVAKDVLGR
ncbi:hypothetical protein ANANG_G00112710, partial [Anguilla anguilla]